MDYCGDCGARSSLDACLACDVDTFVVDADTAEMELQRSQVALLATLAAVLLLAGAGVVLWKLVSEPQESHAAVAPTIVIGPRSTDPTRSILPAPTTTDVEETLPFTTMPSISPTVPGSIVLGGAVDPVVVTSVSADEHSTGDGPGPMASVVAGAAAIAPVPPATAGDNAPATSAATSPDDVPATTGSVLVATGQPPVPFEETTTTEAPPSTAAPTSPPTVSSTTLPPGTDRSLPLAGVPQVIQDPLPTDGLRYSEVQAWHLAAQDVADAAAADSDLVEQSSLILFDARRVDGSGFDLLVVDVSSEGSERTHLYCEVWRVDPAIGAVARSIRVSTVASLEGTYSSPAIVNDDSLNLTIRTTCRWP